MADVKSLNRGEAIFRNIDLPRPMAEKLEAKSDGKVERFRWNKQFDQKSRTAT